MKTLFIESKYNKPIKIKEDMIRKLKGNIGLVSSIQFIDALPDIKEQLEKEKDIVPIIAGQVLGCNVKNAEKIKDRVDSFLYIGDGQFHPLGIAIKTKKQVFTLSPFNNRFNKIRKKDIEDYEKRKKAAMVRFLHAETVGILVSTKPGQHFQTDKIGNLEKKYPNKKFYIFISDTIDYRQFENFPFIQAWVNTACPRIEEDILVLNMMDIEDIK